MDGVIELFCVYMNSKYCSMSLCMDLIYICSIFIMKSYLPQIFSDFIWDFGKLPFPEHLGKYFIKIGKISAKIHEIGKIKAIFGLGMTPI